MHRFIINRGTSHCNYVSCILIHPYSRIPPLYPTTQPPLIEVPFLFPVLGATGTQVMATLQLHGITLGLPVWYLTPLNKYNPPHISMVLQPFTSNDGPVVTPPSASIPWSASTMGTTCNIGEKPTNIGGKNNQSRGQGKPIAQATPSPTKVSSSLQPCAYTIRSNI